MMQNQLEKAINLCKKTGDRLIVFDSLASQNPFVVMNLDEYEKMVLNRSEVRGLTEDELLDKINRDIAIWKSEQESEDYPVDKEEIDSKLAENFTNINENLENSEIKPKKSQWAIKSEVKDGAEEIIEEDRQYLEEITY